MHFISSSQISLTLYGRNISCNGITDFVNEQRGLVDRNIIYNLNGHAIVTKIRDITVPEKSYQEERVLKKQSVAELV